MKYLKNVLLASVILILSGAAHAQTTILAWDFTGLNTVATANATTFNGNLDSTNVISRGANAGASAGANSFRTAGFKNEGISTANTDYFQFAISATTGYTLSLSTINYATAGTASYTVSPGVSMQFAYSLDGTNFTLIGTAATTTASALTTQTGINLTGITALQSLADSTTVTFRFYSSGQTTTGGWGFSSAATAGTNGLALVGTLTAPAVASLTWSGPGGGTWDTSANNFTSGTAAWNNTTNATTKAIFATASQSITAGPVTAGSIQFDASGISVSGGTITNGNATPLITYVTNTNDTATISASINDAAHGFTKDGSGTLILSGAQSGITGGITVTTGTLQSDTTTVGSINVTNSGTFNLNQSGNGTYSGTLTNNSIFIKSGSGNVTIGTAVAGTGSTSITGGTLTAGVDQAVSSGALSLGTGGTTFDMGGHNASVASLSLTGATISNVGILTPTGAITAATDATASTISGGTLALGTTAHAFSVSDGASTYDLVISTLLTGSTGLLTKSGTGTLQLSGNNTGLSNAFSVTAGTIAIGSSNALGTGQIRLNGGGISGNGSAQTVSNLFQLQGSGGTIGGTSDLTLNGNWTDSGATNLNLTISNTGHTTIAGNFAITAAKTIATIVNTNLTISGNISGAGANGSGLSKSGAGTLTLSGANTFNGGTTVTAGSLKLGAVNTLPTAGALTLSGGTLEVNGFSQAGLGTLTLGASSFIDFNNLGATINFGNSSAATWLGTLTINNYVAGSTNLHFGSDATGLTAGQLAQISITGYGAAGLDSSGLLTAVPEPATYAAILGSVGLVGAVIRRKRAAALKVL